MNIDFLEALEEMARERGIDREAAYEAMEKGIAAAYLVEYGGCLLYTSPSPRD